MPDKRGIGFVFFVFGIFLMLNLVSAQFYGGYGGYGRYGFIEEWLPVILVFLLFFALIFFSVGRALGNPSVSLLVSFSISVLIVWSLIQKGYLYGFVIEDIGSWVLVFAVFLIIGLGIRLAYANMGKAGAIFALILFWVGLSYIDPVDFLPRGGLGDLLLALYDIIVSFYGLAVLIIIIFFIIIKKEKKNPLESFIGMFKK